MKKKLSLVWRLAFALIFVLSLGLVGAVPVAAEAAVPTAITDAASGITSTTATLNSAVNANEADPCRF